MSLSWFPLYHGDYLRDTRSLSVAEHGCYLLLIMEFFSKGPLPDNIDRLCLIAAGASPETVRFILTTYWELVEGRWVNKKAAKVLAKQLEEHERNVESGRRGAMVRWAKDDSPPNGPPIAPPISTANGNQNQNQMQSNSTREASRFAPPSATEVAAYAKSIGYLIRVDLFMSHYEANGWKVGRVPMKDWKAAVRQWKARDSEPVAKAKREPML